ncbi:flavin reductase family protein [Kitasatospora phosalacinea]|uniref:flavin reductase family protein n=1 Tax=Kitasatospora phosalacinea TaxID=2065 RepID=UPI003660A72C
MSEPLAAPAGAGAVTPERFRQVLGAFGTGVAAVAALDAGGRPAGLAVSSFTSVSLQPPLVSFCVADTSSSWPRLRDAERLGISVLGDHQLPVCRQLAAKGPDKFRDVDWRPSPGGALLVGGAISWLECSRQDEYPAGDHVIVLCRVHRLGTGEAEPPLLFHRGRPGTFRAHPAADPSDS